MAKKNSGQVHKLYFIPFWITGLSILSVWRCVQHLQTRIIIKINS